MATAKKTPVKKTPAKKAVTKPNPKLVAAFAKTKPAAKAPVAAKKVAPAKKTAKPAPTAASKVAKSAESFKEKAAAVFAHSMMAETPPTLAKAPGTETNKSLLDSVKETIKAAAKTLPQPAKQEGARFKDLMRSAQTNQDATAHLQTNPHMPFKFTSNP